MMRRSSVVVAVQRSPAGESVNRSRTTLLCWACGAGLFVVAAAAGAGEPAVPSVAELRKLIAVYAEYEALSPVEKAKAKRPVFDYPPLSKAGAAAWRQVLWEAWVEQLKATPRNPLANRIFPAWKNVEDVVRGWVETDYWQKPDAKTRLVMRFGAVTFGEKPKTGWPVFINLHGGGLPPSVNDNAWYSTMGQYPVKQGLYLCPRSVVDSLGSWNDPRSAAALEQLIAELPATWEIDPNRVYLVGFSMGGIGVLHLGPLMPDRWAAVAATSGLAYLGANGRAAPDNLRNLPTMIQVGTKDMDFQRYPLIKAFAEALQGLRGRDPLGYLLEYKEHPGRGHQIDDRDAPAWLGQFVRDPLPRRIVWQQPILPLPLGKEDLPKVLAQSYDWASYLRHRCYWLRNDAPTVFQRLVVSREGNLFRIEQACHVERVTLLMDDRMADLDKPVRVMAGDRELARAEVKRTVTALVASLVEYRDPELMFCAEWTVPAPDSVAEMERCQLTTAPDLLLRAQERLALKRFADAAADIESALKLDPRRAPAQLRTLIRVYAVLEDEARVLDAHKRLAEAAPEDAAAQFEAAMLLMLCQRQELHDDKTALRLAEKAAELTRHKDPQILRATALAYFRNGRKEKAVETVKEALALLPAGQLPNLRAALDAQLREFGGREAGNEVPGEEPQKP
jgi:tetratricopeptide (TPR) repeat protein